MFFCTDFAPVDLYVRSLGTVRKKCQSEKMSYFHLLCKLLAKPSYKHPPTMASADYRSGTPLLPTIPLSGRNDSKWS
jgi:hypothetical protein